MILAEDHPFDVALIQRASIGFYPPLINQANLLVEAGARVVVLDGGIGPPPGALHPEVRLIRPLGSTSSSAARRLLGMLQFVWAVRAVQRSRGIRVRVGYDSPAMAAMAATSFRGLTVCHFHEYPEIPGYEGWKADAERRVARRFARSSDLTVMPDSYRAAALAREDGLARLPTVVRNCPRRLTRLPANRLSEVIARWQGIFTVLFQGAVAENYYADKIVRSMAWWPPEAVMVFLGPIRGEFEDRLRGLAQEVGVRDRVVFLSRVPYSELFGYTVGADLGLTMIKPHTFNFAHMAGASNKRYEFMACGIAQISNHGPGMHELLEGNGVGLCVDAEKPEQIGRAVTGLLGDELLRVKMGERGRRLHLDEYNYEAQFAGVLETVASYLEQAE